MIRNLAARVGIALTLCALETLACAPPAASADEAASLRLASVDAVGGSHARVVVVVPSQLAMQNVPAAAFRVTEDERTVTATVQRVADAGLDVYVVVDTGVAPTTLAAEQSAAADLLRNLPADVHTATVDGGSLSIPSAQPDRAAALLVLGAVRPSGTSFLPAALKTISGMPARDRRRVIVLLTDCRQQGAGALSSLVSSLGTGDQQLDVVAPGSNCPAQLASLASLSSGVGVVGGSADRLAQALDSVLFDLLGQYRVSVPLSADRQSVTITVDYAGVHAATDVPFSPSVASAQSPRSPPGKPSDRSSQMLLAGLAALAAIILAATAIGAARAGLRARRTPA